jgi:hypothetical protein
MADRLIRDAIAPSTDEFPMSCVSHKKRVKKDDWISVHRLAHHRSLTNYRHERPVRAWCHSTASFRTHNTN